MLRTVVFCALLFPYSIRALADQVIFDGYPFSTFGLSTATMNPDGSVTLSQDAATGFFGVVLDSSLRYATLTYADHTNTNIDLFLQCCAGAGVRPPDIRITSGSESSFSGIGRVSYQNAAPFGMYNESYLYAVPGRTNGAIHRVSVYEAPDGTAYESFDGATYSSSFLADNIGPFGITDIAIQIQNGGGSGNAVTLLSFQAAASIPEPASIAFVLGGCLMIGLKALIVRK